jgi:hypothetical protein
MPRSSFCSLGVLARPGGLGTCARTAWAAGRLGGRQAPPHVCGSSLLGLLSEELSNGFRRDRPTRKPTAAQYWLAAGSHTAPDRPSAMWRGGTRGSATLQACQGSNRRQLGLRLIDRASTLCTGLPGPLSRSRAREPGRRPGPEPGRHLQGGPPWPQACSQPAAWVSCPVGALRSGRLQVGLGMTRTARGCIMPRCQTVSTIRA